MLPKIIYIEDKQVLHLLLAAYIRGRATLVSATTIAEGEQVITENPDAAIAILDGTIETDNDAIQLAVLLNSQGFKGQRVANSSQHHCNAALAEVGFTHIVEKATASMPPLFTKVDELLSALQANHNLQAITTALNKTASPLSLASPLM